MSTKEDAKQKTEQQKSIAPKETPFAETKFYGPLIQQYGIIIRNNKGDRNSEAAKKFLEEHPDFTDMLQAVAILEHFRNAQFNTVFEESAPPIISVPATPAEASKENVRELETAVAVAPE